MSKDPLSVLFAAGNGCESALRRGLSIHDVCHLFDTYATDHPLTIATP